MSVTDGDREKAWEMVRLSYQPCPDEALRDAIAAALAEEREKARAPFRNLVAFYDRHEYSTLNVDDLRQILEENE